MGQDRNGLFDDPPPRPSPLTALPRLTVGAAVLGAVAGSIVALGLLRQGTNSSATPPPAYVPVIAATNNALTASAGTGTPSAAASSASPSPSASPRATRPHPSPSPTSAAPSPLPPRAYEGDASANILAGGARADSCSACPDGTKIRFLGNGGTLTFPNVSASTAGSYTLTIAFTEGDTSGGRTAVVTVDGVDTDVYFSGNGDWNSLQTLTITVHLDPGYNRIEFANPDAMAPDIAQIVV